MMGDNEQGRSWSQEMESDSDDEDTESVPKRQKVLRDVDGSLDGNSSASSSHETSGECNTLGL